MFQTTIQVDNSYTNPSKVRKSLHLDLSWREKKRRPGTLAASGAHELTILDVLFERHRNSNFGSDLLGTHLYITTSQVTSPCQW